MLFYYQQGEGYLNGKAKWYLINSKYQDTDFFADNIWGQIYSHLKIFENLDKVQALVKAWCSH